MRDTRTVDHSKSTVANCPRCGLDYGHATMCEDGIVMVVKCGTVLFYREEDVDRDDRSRVEVLRLCKDRKGVVA